MLTSPVPSQSFTSFSEPTDTALQRLVREAAIVRESIDGPPHVMDATAVTLVFAWVQSAQALPEPDRQTLADLGLDATQLLPSLHSRSPHASESIVRWLRHFDATVNRGRGGSAHR